MMTVLSQLFDVKADKPSLRLSRVTAVNLYTETTIVVGTASCITTTPNAIIILVVFNIEILIGDA